MKKFFGVALFLASVSAFAGGGSSVGDGNPASVNCVKLGGTLEFVETPQGQVGNCVIGEWTLYQEMANRDLVVHHHYGPGGMPNPAAVNCNDIGGEIRIIETPAGQSGYCVVEEWTLYRVIHVAENN